MSGRSRPRTCCGLNLSKHAVLCDLAALMFGSDLLTTATATATMLSLLPPTHPIPSHTIPYQDATDPDWLRMTPFGHDSSGRLYYRFVMFRKEMRVYR